MFQKALCAQGTLAGLSQEKGVVRLAPQWEGQGPESVS